MARESTPPASTASSPALRAARDETPPLVTTKATPAGAFQAARRMFLAGRRLDMQSLAAELGVSRATLYRWTGHRDRLLADVLQSLAYDLFERTKADHPEHTGAPRIRAIFSDYLRALVSARPLHLFLQQETHAALRILTARAGPVQQGTIGSIEELLREEANAGTFTPRTDIPTLAFAIARIGEGFIYDDAIVAIEPQVDEAERIIALLLE